MSNSERLRLQLKAMQELEQEFRIKGHAKCITEVVDGLRSIVNFTYLEMRGGDAARKIAKRLLSKLESPSKIWFSTAEELDLFLNEAEEIHSEADTDDRGNTWSISVYQTNSGDFYKASFCNKSISSYERGENGKRYYLTRVYPRIVTKIAYEDKI